MSASLAVRCGELACQKDSYLRTLQATVLELRPKAPDKKQKKKLYECTLSDTVLFPEGGGQPCDTGSVGGVTCSRVDNVAGVAVHTLEGELKVGDSVTVNVDWERRWDHAVQHSAQHLISALALRDFGAETLSWSYGAEACVVELSSSFDAGQLESTTNAAIRDGLTVKAEWHSVADVNSGAVDGLRMSSRALPESVTGPVRVVRFAGVDTNTCCGTHVSVTSHIQAVKLLKCEAPSKKGSVKVHFVAGGRVMERLGSAFEREVQLGLKLSAGPDLLVQRLEDTLKQRDDAQRSSKQLTKEVALLKAQTFDNDASCIVHTHRDAPDPDLAKLLAAAVAERAPRRLLLQTFDPGSFLLSGPADLLDEVKAPIAEALGGKGGGKADRFQGKCAKPKEGASAVKVATDIINNLKAA